jgi:predicted XRE-type DNA-binding protein
MTKKISPEKAAAIIEVEEAAAEWRATKKRERAAREILATAVRNHVDSETLSENKISTITGIPRMTIRKMMGKL